MIIETRHTEERFSTSSLTKMRGKFLAESLLRSWKEDFVDEDTGEVVSIERNERIANRGVVIDGDLLATIQFHLNAKDITEVVVSTQKREALLYKNTHSRAWLVTIEIVGKRKKFLLYAQNLVQATEVVKDYVELNFAGFFDFVSVKDFDHCIMIRDTYKLVESECDNEVVQESQDIQEKKFYQLKTEIVTCVDEEEEEPYFSTFIVETTDIEKAILLIKDYTAKLIRVRGEKEGKFNLEIDIDVKLEEAKPILCNYIIDKNFSIAYAEV